MTDFSAVEKRLQETAENLREGADSQVRLTNYQKCGETFETLLALRSVRDAYGRPRFCVALSLPIDERIKFEEELTLVHRLLSAMPLTISMPDDEAEPPLTVARVAQLAAADSALLDELHAATAHAPTDRRVKQGLAASKVGFDPLVGRAHSRAELTRVYWTILSTEQVAAMLDEPNARRMLIAHIHARSGTEEDTLRGHLAAAGGSVLAAVDSMRDYLDRLASALLATP